MWGYDNFTIFLEKLFSNRIKLPKDSHSAILFEDLNTSSFYYIINNNKNNIYTTDELHTITHTTMMDPYTRQPITSYAFVKIRFA